MNVSFMLGITLKLITSSSTQPSRAPRHLSLKEAFQTYIKMIRGRARRNSVAFHDTKGGWGREKGIKSNPQKILREYHPRGRAKAITFHKFNNMTSIVRKISLLVKASTVAWWNVAPTYIAFDQKPQWKCIHTRVFHYRKIFYIIPTLLRLHKSMKLRFLPLLFQSLFSSLSEQYKKYILWREEKILRQMRNLNFLFFPPLAFYRCGKLESSLYTFILEVIFSWEWGGDRNTRDVGEAMTQY